MLKNTQLPYKPSIFKQGLLLIAVPLTVGTCILFFLNQLWQSTEQIAEHERAQVFVVDLMDTVIKSWGVMSGSLFGEAVEQNTAYEATVKKSVPLISFHFNQLKLLTGAQPKQHQLVLRLEEISKEEYEAFAALPRSSSAGMELETLAKLPKTLAKIYKLRTELRRILANQLADLQILRTKQHEGMHTMKMLAYLFAFGNIVLAVFLVWQFSRSISSRLKILINSAALLPRLQVPQQHLEGLDELSYLDRVLTTTAEHLKEASLHRQSIMGMVAHDMRSPLMASQANVLMVEEVGGEFCEEAFEKLDLVQEKLSQIITFVEQLLKLQKKGQLSDESVIEAASLKNNALLLPETGVITFSSLIAAFLKPKIIHQGFVLVLVPLLFQSAFLFFVNQQIQRTETIAFGEAQISDFNLISSLLSVDMTRGAAAQGIYLISGSETARKLSADSFAELERDYEKLAGLAAKNADWKDYVEKARNVSRAQVGRLCAIGRDGQRDQIFAEFADLAELKARSPEAFRVRQMGNILQIKNLSALQRMESEQADLAQLWSQVFGMSVFANFLLAFILLHSFSNNTSKRLGILMRNASLLGTNESLPQALTGTDELAFLDLILHQSKEELDSASRQRGQMMLSLAEEMRIPLRHSQLELERFAVLTESVLPEQSKRNLLRSQVSIERVLSLVDDLLSIESLQTGKVDLELNDCDIRNLAEEAISTVASLAGKKQIELLNNCQSELLRADKARLLQVLINYLSNAIKFSPENSVIKVETHCGPEFLRVSVQDQGPGMDQDTRERVFEKFFQANTEQKKQGFGLGLAICQLLVQAHNGRLGVESEVGKGSSFWFEIPRK
ncbi:MAG: hypothetical protein K2X27_03585 [Candidatus Obscuribacterales bacterium]|nr:hypothetical protein [Candidatus Obscuribacterales bacterium]